MIEGLDGGADQVAEASGEISNAGQSLAAGASEQATGIGQVNQAVTEMDKVVQQNAANAEESASAGEEMNAQAVQMKAMVSRLVALIKGNSDRHTSGNGYNKHNLKPLAPVRITSAETGIVPGSVADSRKKEISPEKLIPMTDGDFEDF